MLYLIKKDDNKTSNFHHFIDSPKDKLLSVNGETLVRGWAFPAHPNQTLSIFIKKDGIQKQISFNQPRPDVVNHFKDKYNIDQLCGFSISLSNFSEAELIIETNNQSTCILKLEKTTKNNENFYRELDSLIESFSKNTHRIEKFRPTQRNQLSELYLWQENQDIQSIASYICNIINNDNFSLPHPLKPEIKTYAQYSSTHDSGTNYIIFSDINYSNLWCLTQEENFIDVIFTNGLAIEFSTQKAGLINNFNKNNIDYSLYNPDSPRKNISFFLYHCRPYHFFYDYLKYFHYLIATKKLNLPLSTYTHNPFLPLEIFGDKITINKEKPQLLLSPTLVATNRIKRSTGEGNTALGNSILYKEITKNIEEIISNSFEDNTLLQEDFDLKIWIGISAEKRKWIEQVEGYAEIITELSRQYKKILILSDGLTAPHGKKLKNTADMEFFEKIKKLVTNRNIQFHSLIGEDYATKIKYCKHIDFFISDAGTGCVVPLRLCKKPGVLFSNKTLFTFPDDYPDTIKIVHKDHVTDIINNNKTADFISYSIDWRQIYKEVRSVIYMIKGDSLSSTYTGAI